MKSMGEVKCAADMEDKGISYMYENDTLEYQYKVQTYTPDFTLLKKIKIGPKSFQFRPVYIEYKGKLDKATRDKMLAVKACNPNAEIFLVFENANNGITKRRKLKNGKYNTPTRYWEWAEKKGFGWSEHTIKEEWLH